jgi:hypothetical protein
MGGEGGMSQALAGLIRQHIARLAGGGGMGMQPGGMAPGGMMAGGPRPGAPIQSNAPLWGRHAVGTEGQPAGTLINSNTGMLPGMVRNQMMGVR